MDRIIFIFIFQKPYDQNNTMWFSNKTLYHDILSNNLCVFSLSTSCEYGALRAAPPLPYPSLQELPDMAETSIIVATSGGTHGGPPHQGPPSLSPGPVHHLASSHPHHSLALSHTNLQHLSTSNSSSTATTNGGLGSSQHISNSNSLNSSVSSNGSGGGGTLVVQPDGSTTTTNTATSTILTVRMIMQGKVRTRRVVTDILGAFL